ncbi:MAG: hypothetical protein HUJ57_03580, partial [Erysipelotrichaceae bacterium]|nr:hypothetical protein [Erysipelotrichaceae bacterium]
DGKEFDAKQPINEDVTIYAKWDSKTTADYTVKYVDAVTKADLLPAETLHGVINSYVAPKAKNIEGMVADAAQKSLKVTADPNNNVVVFEYTSISSLSYIVRYLFNDEILDEKDPVTAVAKTFNVVIDQADRDALLNLGYKLVNNEHTKRVTVTPGVNYVDFQFEVSAYKITYNGLESTDGWENGSTSNPNPGQYTVLTDAFTLVNPTREGYEFDGWKFVQNKTAGTETTDKNVTVRRGSRGNLTFTATWKIKKFTLTGSGTNATVAPASETYDYSKTATTTVTYTPATGYKITSVKVDGEDKPFTAAGGTLSVDHKKSHTVVVNAAIDADQTHT